MDRKERLLSLFDATGVGLEIGPSFNPLLPKRDGYDVETLDHLSAADLREKYKNASVDLSAIEEVDYLSDGGSIRELIGKPEHYDYIVASHVIEHTTDLLGFVSDCEQLLKRTGLLVLAVPDKRFCFDCLRPCSTSGQILQAHLEQRKRHTPGQVFDEIAYNCLGPGQVRGRSRPPVPWLSPGLCRTRMRCSKNSGTMITFTTFTRGSSLPRLSG